MARLQSRIYVEFQSVVLIDGTLELESEPQLAQASREVQEFGTIGGTYGQSIDRGNQRNVFSFQRRKPCADWYDAFIEMLDFQATIPTGSDVATITVLDADAATPLSTWFLQSCSVKSFPGIARNHVAIHSIILTGGEFAP